MHKSARNKDAFSFVESADYARVLRYGGGPDRGALDDLGSLGGEDAEIMRATYGRSEQDFVDAIAYELSQEQRSRPNVFVRKLRSSRRRASRGLPSGSGNPSRLITEAEFSALHAAAEFAYTHGLTFETSVTINWRLLERADGEIPIQILAFTKCLRAWLKYHGLAVAWIYVNENGPSGLHTYFLIHIPPSHRVAFRKWMMGWIERSYSRRVSRAARVRGPLKSQPILHWRLVSYALKGYDGDAVVVSASNAPDGVAIRLGDLIAAPWQDSGPVPFERTGICHNLGPKQRRVGAPREFVPSPAPFGARYHEGCRDVRALYPEDFYELVTCLPAVLPQSADAEKGGDFNIHTLNL
jgi:hypothetical protein